jgi:uncharacterized protein (DUF1015 family)
MTLVNPFPARIVKQDQATNVVCPMHDALSPAQRANLLLENPLSYLNVTRSTLDMPGASYEEIGAANAEGLERLLRSGAYGDLWQPAVYVYRICQNGEEHTGIVADLDVSGFVDGRVLGHENTNPDKVHALAQHFEAVPTRSELVAVMHRDDDVVADVVASVTATVPILTVTDLTGVEQQVWRVNDHSVIAERLDGVTHYVADGHHRVAATVERWHDHGSPRGGTVLSVLYAQSQTHLLAFHRLVAGPIDADQLLSDLRGIGEVTEVSGPTSGHGIFGLHVGGRWHTVTPRIETRLPGAAGLDVTLLDELVLKPLLGTWAGHERVSYVSELADVQEAAATHSSDALFLLTAPTHDELIDVAERGEVMPPKSTYIEPKPRAGIFLHPRQGPVDPRDLPPAAEAATGARTA